MLIRIFLYFVLLLFVKWIPVFDFKFQWKVVGWVRLNEEPVRGVYVQIGCGIVEVVETYLVAAWDSVTCLEYDTTLFIIIPVHHVAFPAVIYHVSVRKQAIEHLIVSHRD